MKKVLIYFGSRGYEASRQRLYLNAKDHFHLVIAYGEEDIDPAFYSAHEKIFSHLRGWGYWLWKPYFILKTLQELNEGDCCFYVDSTAVFHHSPEILFDLCIKNEGILLFDNSTHQNYTWTKADCFNLMALSEEKYVYGRQADAAMQVYQKNERSIQFVTELLSYATNYHIISDAPNITGENHADFRDHRHDQSILSLLAIKHNIPLNPSPRRNGNYAVNNYNKLLELKRDVVVPKQDLRQIHGFLSKTIFREFYKQPFPNKPFYNSNIQFFSFYLYTGLIRVFSGEQVAPGFFAEILATIPADENADQSPIDFFDVFFINNRSTLLGIMEDSWCSNPRCTWLKDWEAVCREELDSREYTLPTLLLLFRVINEQLSFPEIHFAQRIRCLQQLFEHTPTYQNRTRPEIPH